MSARPLAARPLASRLVGAVLALALGAAAQAAEPARLSVMFVGHSLVARTLPDMLADALRAFGLRARVDAQITNGAPLSWNWERAAEAEGANARALLPAGGHEVLVLTEAQPLRAHLRWSDTARNIARFAALARQGRAHARVYLYETWPCLGSGAPEGCAYDDHDDQPWRARVAAELPLWRKAAADAGRLGAGQVLLIPAGQAMARVEDAARRGAAAGLDGARALFADDIHPNALGFYLVAMTHFAAIVGRDPSGLPATLRDRYGKPFPAPPPGIAAFLQRTAWEAVCAEPLSGVRC
ncbi:hypothetical protein [Oceanicella actignis]|uniref:SGNH/GDSL hydrolase family protein n=1 Tax=Oceanicella actignis TaxID=1189325 RepID=A0A1M7T500_9RHOB|nr:hypothetical protein [Oceanicella actignis]SET42479.1 hypothetical protein SAMN04488119_104165 [Oceanicella actignis]SHN65786.1 hypothetical protein SAMN05216200_104165 [Oceanicella actignis]